MSIGVNIKQKRLACNMTQKELAEKVKVDQSMICQLERGTKTPSLPLGMEIAQVLQCPLEALLE
ncbi:helix-turn-helix transcriptional regulator [Anaeromassilibacillus senegalensis]|uniref:helix-turn-helix transcriptional regulator n=1 Tax=Anaeromassilibacillus senegalensis TaxID=1673717 RepID=UPI00068099B2|nr:helix-turn-helix transcriptional regulator [Anaeromassilibacillus senegalensis]